MQLYLDAQSDKGDNQHLNINKTEHGEEDFFAQCHPDNDNNCNSFQNNYLDNLVRPNLQYILPSSILVVYIYIYICVLECSFMLVLCN